MCPTQSEMWVATKSQHSNHHMHFVELVILCNVSNKLLEFSIMCVCFFFVKLKADLFICSNKSPIKCPIATYVSLHYLNKYTETVESSENVI